MVRPYRYVGMVSYDDFTLHTHQLAGSLLSNCSDDACCQAYKAHSVLLRKSPRLFQMAEEFIHATIGPRRPFIAGWVAGHLLPIPNCRYWRAIGFGAENGRVPLSGLE